MRTVPARNNNFGDHYEQSALLHWGTRWPGDTTPMNPWHLYDFNSRWGQSSNPLESDGWRRQSNYYRFVRAWEDCNSALITNGYGDRIAETIGGGEGHIHLCAYWPFGAGNSVFEDNNIRNKSITKALNSIQDGKAQIGNSLAEAKTTFQQLSRSAIGLLTAYRSARRGNWRKVQNDLGLADGQVLWGRFPANKWLEYQYGWKPLMSDIHDAYGLTTNRVLADDFRCKGRGVGKRDSKSSDEFDDGWTRSRCSREQWGEQSFRTVLFAKITSPRWRYASQVGLANPLSVAWEVVPFSFLVDWFMPVGNVLEALTARAGLTFSGGATSCRTYYESKVRTKHSYDGFYRINQGCQLYLRVSALSRTVHPDWPLPMLYVEESPFSTTRSLNALALWRSTIKT